MQNILVKMRTSAFEYFLTSFSSSKSLLLSTVVELYVIYAGPAEEEGLGTVLENIKSS